VRESKFVLRLTVSLVLLFLSIGLAIAGGEPEEQEYVDTESWLHWEGSDPVWPNNVILDEVLPEQHEIIGLSDWDAGIMETGQFGDSGYYDIPIFVNFRNEVSPRNHSIQQSSMSFSGGDSYRKEGHGGNSITNTNTVVDHELFVINVDTTNIFVAHNFNYLVYNEYFCDYNVVAATPLPAMLWLFIGFAVLLLHRKRSTTLV